MLTVSDTGVTISFLQVATQEPTSGVIHMLDRIECSAVRRVLVCLGSLASAPVWSATSAQPTEAPSPQAALTEVIVTATKRSESVQDVPLSITVLDGEALERAGMVDFKDYAVHVPNLAFSYLDFFGPTAQSIAIRGVEGANTTGMYLDETPLPENLDPRAIDLARIEVLRGPQGTLYGAESMGGTVRLITRQPSTSGFEASVHDALSYTDHGGVNDALDGMLNLPLSQTAALRFVAFADRISGVYDRLPSSAAPVQFAARDHLDSSRHQGGSVAGLFNFDDNQLTVTPRFIFERSAADGKPYADITPGNFKQYRLFDIAEPSRDDWNLGTLTLRWRTPAGDITSATSYFSRSGFANEDFSEAADLTFGLPQTPALIIDQLHFTATSEELRFASSFRGPFQLTSGLFYQDSIQHFATPDTPFGPIDNVFSQATRTEITESALFTEATYELTPQLRLLAGARAFDNKVRYVATLAGAATNPGTFSGEQTGKGVNPKYSLEYSVNPDVKVYTTAAKGFRVGGINAYPDAVCAGDLEALHLNASDTKEYNSDTLWSYEIGVKSDFFAHKLRLNTAAYHIDWSGLQQLLQLPSCGFNLTVNSGKARSDGAEIELDALASPGLNLSFGAGYENARIVDSGLVTAIPTGARVQQIPRFNLTANVDYETQILGHEFFAHADLAYISSSISTNNSLATPLIRGAYALTNARIGQHIGKVDVALFVDNLFNRMANLGDPQPEGIALPGRPRLATNRPLTAGLDIRIKF